MDATVGTASDEEAGLPYLSESILAIDVKDRSTLGCSVFCTTDGVLKIGADISMAGEDVVEQFLSYAQPTTILVSRRVPESTFAFIEKHAGRIIKVTLRLVSPSDFSHTFACEELSSLDTHGICSFRTTSSANVDGQCVKSSIQALQEHDRQEPQCMKLVRCSSLIDLDNISSLSCADQSNIINKIIDRIVPVSLTLVGDMINRAINFNETKSQQYCSVMPGVDTELDALKRQYDGMSSFLTAVVNRVAEDLPVWARQYIQSCVFLPQLGFLTVVEQESQLGNDIFNGGSVNDNSWKKSFTHNGTAYYKNRHMEDLDRYYGDMYSKISDKEVEVMQKLASNVIVHEKALLEAADLCGEFDALLALAIGAAKYDWHAPQMTAANVIHIKGGRHPLQELLVPSFVPNDCFIGDEGMAPGRGTQALVLTGPNQSGKSVYIKQVAVIVYLAHIGSFVPAEAALIGTVDKILTRMPSRESVSRIGSTFALDLKQVFQAMKYSTSRSLVLMDEFGNGTAADGGAGMFTAMLDYFLSPATAIPKLLVATHFHEVFSHGYLNQHKQLSLMHMEVVA
ncbi:uncharacterized protein TrAFT101_007458 [Trichoderma asperellum]|uniref:uncharacterized protein n=1 Tax=Trichoderma asperellum TaxID=101201 RepID=UPI003316F6DE|nr:hypothetical protein TrAFT101_007458 [Trichoderma asperellum]